jgi:uncharacterized protein with PIN domain
MAEKFKKQKRLSKRCPDCGGILESVSHTHADDGVEYSEEYIECSECGYSEKMKSSPKRYKDYYNPKW